MADREVDNTLRRAARAGMQGPAGERPPKIAPDTVLFEVAWEVCNQLGGIYQVLRSKAPLMVERWDAHYCLIGPYNADRAQLEFEETRPVGWMARVIKALGDEGLVVHHGRWLIQGRPRVLLIEHGLDKWRLDEVKARIFRDHAIEAVDDGIADGVVSFGEAVRRFFEKVFDPKGGGAARGGGGSGGAAGSSRGAGGPGAEDGQEAGGSGGRGTGPRRVVAHFHEWMGGLAIPMLRKRGLPVGMVFTTHATQLGRYMSHEEGFYDWLAFVDPEAAAGRYGVRMQHQIERACAHGSHVFTTVSAITAEECAALLGRQCDLVLPNGLNIARYYVGHEFQTLHGKFKEELNLFTMGHFFGNYSFDLDKTLYFFTSGRFEPRNKGFDLCVEAMARLNGELRAGGGAGLGITVVFFIITQRPTKSLNPLVLHHRGVLNELKEVCKEVTDGVGDRLFKRAAAGGKLALDDLVEEYWTLRYRRTQHALKTQGLPFITTHMFEDDGKDEVLNQVRNVWLFNRHDDPVKVVYHPDFISPVNPLWGIEYEQFVRGCHLGVFPSAYEPWGYTPMECIAMGVPAVTSDLAGFGRYIQESYPDHESWGLHVLKRRGRSFHEAAHHLSQHLLAYCKMSRRDRIQLRNEVERRAWEFDWGKLGEAYHKAHDLALERVGAVV
jgi:glycogen(starch) synthase